MNYLIFRKDNEYPQGTLNDHLAFLSRHGGSPECWSSNDDLLSALQEAKLEHEKSGKSMVVYDTNREIILETYTNDQ